ncbi:SDR family NAD(P)-dependent oxidoreductase [Nonomuraea sp. NPDC049400]|uniref:SDR family NAD(P)-dependent oxidoreductase n=1 Tax=Nonomuraea sp. NPDC049400 TaxID=3364352 RepID=UPI00378B214F
MDLGLEGKCAVVTGGSRGIGLAVVRELRREGVEVVAASRKGSNDLAILKVPSVEVDLTLPESSAELGDRVRQHLGEVDFWVNCVGGIEGASLQDDLVHIIERWKATFDVNVVSALRVADELLPDLIARRGAIVHIAGLSARRAGLSPLDYGAAKKALIAVSQHLAIQYGPYGVRSNTISPGPTATHLWESVAAENAVSLDALYAALPATVGMTTGRMIDPKEIAALAVFLLSSRAASITGADHIVSAGLSA